MMLRLHLLLLATPLAWVLPNSCTSPISDPEKLKSIKGEAQFMMASYPIKPPDDSVDVPMNRLPPTIASLKPDIMLVRRDSVDIVVKAFFDGGWGYSIAADGRTPPRPAGCYDEPYQGVFWFVPC